MYHLHSQKPMRLARQVLSSYCWWGNWCSDRSEITQWVSVILRIQVSSFSTQFSDIVSGKCWQIPTLSFISLLLLYFNIFHQCHFLCILGWLPSSSKYVRYNAQVPWFMVCVWFRVSVCFSFNYIYLDMLLQSQEDFFSFCEWL